MHVLGRVAFFGDLLRFFILVVFHFILYLLNIVSKGHCLKGFLFLDRGRIAFDVNGHRKSRFETIDGKDLPVFLLPGADV